MGGDNLKSVMVTAPESFIVATDPILKQGKVEYVINEDPELKKDNDGYVSTQFKGYVKNYNKNTNRKIILVFKDNIKFSFTKDDGSAVTVADITDGDIYKWKLNNSIKLPVTKVKNTNKPSAGILPFVMGLISQF